VNIKKGQWMHPEGMRGSAAKVIGARPNLSPNDIAITERGTFFGYGDLVVDMRSFAALREATKAPVIFDGTHSVQQPGKGSEGASGGLRQHIPALVLAAVAAGAQGLFIETHPTPDSAPSDGPNMLPLTELPLLVRRAVSVWEARRT
jgi:2-dehydro-3-deoxyphosphooctonate aldolase (KDO 8-P synthase)